jgi:peptidoglycan/xylan/chitin deacetylase (PgdA/CDA1 family)
MIQIDRFLIFSILLLLNLSIVNATIYEDAEDGTISRWSIVDNIPEGATVNNIYDEERHSRVIELNGSDSYDNQYQLGDTWNNQREFNIKWDMKTTDGFIIDIVVSSANGDRYLRYNDNEKSYKGKDDEIIYHGIGYHSTNGDWNSFTRDLQSDLQEIEPNNTILAINSFLIRSKCRIDNIEFFKKPIKVYEDAEDKEISRWSIYRGGDGAKIRNIYDSQKGSRVISLEGNSYDHQYLIGGDSYNEEGWGDNNYSNISWSMKNSDGFILYLTINTTSGIRFIKYFDGDFPKKGIIDDVIYYGLGNSASNGKWHTFIRDIEADVQEFEPNNRVLSVEGLVVIGSILIDDLELFNILHPVTHKSGLTLTFDDHSINSWYSMRNIYLEYGAKVTFFVDKFHTLSSEKINKLKILEQDGHEIGCHTYNHKGIGRDYDYNISRVDEYMEEQIIPAVTNMQNAGFDPKSMAYPYGEHEKSFDSAVRTYLPYLRTTDSDSSRELYELHEIYHNEKKYYNLLSADGIDNYYDNEINEIREALIKARKNGEIITLYAHRVTDDPNQDYVISHKKLKNIIEIAKEIGLNFYTFSEAYKIGNN